MRVVFANHSLDHAGGIESYTTTVADHLQRFGHDVWIYTPEDGFTGEVARSMGLRVETDASRLPDDVDAVLAQDGVAALEMLAIRPAAPQIYCWHSELFDLHVPPQLDGVTARIVTFYAGARKKAEALAVSAPIVELTHPIDTERFKPRAPLRAKPRALALGNYLTGERFRILEQACEIAGIELNRRGSHAEGGVTARPEDDMGRADIVFAKAKAAIEAMACGRAVYVYDAFGSDGWVTPQRYPRLEANCFAGTGGGQTVEIDALVAALGEYDPAMGVVNRDLAVANHGAIEHTSAIASLVAEVSAEARDGATPERHDNLFELARLSRVVWRHESSAFSAAARLQQSELEKGDLACRLEAAQDELARSRAAEEKLAEIVNSRRWRALNGLLKPLDRARGRS